MTVAAIRLGPRRGRSGRRPALAVLLGCLVLLLAAGPARAQPDQMSLQSDEFVFNYDEEVLSAVGNVVITYRGHRLTADRVTYYQATGRLVAAGNVVIVDPTGAVYETAYADVTDDFRQGFIRELFVSTADRTFFTAESATRDGQITEFDRAVYTACSLIETRPDTPPLWQIRAARIIYNQEEQMIYFEQARFELAGVPIAWLPRFAMPDPSVTRKTGFLFPEISYSEALGIGVEVPFFWAPDPSYDLTLTTTYFTRQGLLEDAEWRHRLERGLYTFEAAGIRQRDGEALGDAAGPSFRGGVRTTGDFALNRFWSLGWDGTLQTDRGFSQDYDVLNPANDFIISEAHVTGVLDQAYLDAQVLHFRDVRSPSASHDQTRQAIVRPTIDHEYVFDRPVLGGELVLSGNLTSLSRDENDPFTVGGTTFYYGLAGTFTRISEDLTWRRQIDGPAGMLFQPFAFAEVDAFFLEPTAAPAGFSTEAVATRGMVGVGVEWRWPWLIATAGADHVIEPIVQLIARPSETMIGALPNDDAQSLVFDTTNLLAWNKFSGDDRVEGGTRLNVALRYVGRFGDLDVEAMIGQSYHLHGVNSFATQDLANSTADTGLETDVSDVVASVSATTAGGHRLSAAGRFDHAGLVPEEASLTASGAFGRLTASAGVNYDRDTSDIKDAAQAGFSLSTSASFAINDQWSVHGGLRYDVPTSTLTEGEIGVRYECDCASFSLTYSESRDAGSSTVERTILAGLTLRTLAAVDLAVSPDM